LTDPDKDQLRFRPDHVPLNWEWQTAIVQSLIEQLQPGAIDDLAPTINLVSLHLGRHSACQPLQ